MLLPIMPRRMRIARVLLQLPVLCLLASCEWRVAEAHYEAEPVPRFSVARLTGGSPWEACRPVPRDSVTPSPACARKGSTVAALPLAATDAREPDARARRLAIIDLAWSDAAPGALARSLAQLTRLAARRPADAGLLNDLAVAHLTEAAATDALLHALRALDAAEQARALAPQDATIAWNVAVIQEHLQLREAALATWEIAERLETESGWLTELRERKGAWQRLILASRTAIETDSLLASGDAVPQRMLSSTASMMAQWSRDRAWAVLSRWAACLSRGDEPGAQRQRELLRPISNAERQRGGDQSVAAAAQELDAIGNVDSPERKRLVRGYTALGAALEHYRTGGFDDAIALLQKAATELGSSDTSPALWTQYYLAASHASRGDYEMARRRFEDLLARSRAFPVLSGKVRLGVGVIEGRRGNMERAIQWFLAAQDDLARARDRESQGFAAFLLAETYALQGRRQDSYAAAWQSIRMNAGFRRSPTLRNQITQLATLARGEGLPRAALSIGDESVAIARGVGLPMDRALAYRDVAKDARTLGLDSLSMRALDSADYWARRVAAGRGGDRVRAYVDLGRGGVLRHRSPKTSLAPLQRAVSVLRGFRDDVFLPVALHESALSLLAVGDSTAAQQLLDEAIDVLEAQYEQFRSSSLRASFAETAEQVFDSRIDLALRRHDGAAAFASLERSRRAAYRPDATTERAGVSRGSATSLATIQSALPKGTTMLEYALLADRVAIWRIDRDTSVLVEVAVRRDSLTALIAGMQHAMTSGSVQPPPASGALHALLLRPALHGVAPGTSLIIVPDRELFQLSFAWLRDDASRRFAIESHALRYAPSAEFVTRTVQRDTPIQTSARVLSLGYDAKSGSGMDSLPALMYAEAEARGVAALYSRADLLTGAQVSRPAVRRSAQRADLVHFAGHAVFDEARPEQSYLLLGSGGDGAHLLAGEIATLRTSKLRLVVLSGCRTLNARASRVGPVSGLAYSFLQAGASGTVTSLWDVDDGAAATFMTAFHTRLAAGVAPAEALQAAQLVFLRSPDSRMQSPRIWAGFTLTGS